MFAAKISKKDPDRHPASSTAVNDKDESSLPDRGGPYNLRARGARSASTGLGRRSLGGSSSSATQEQ
ncbi:hypothetical protein AAVH_43177 [Aphelenchoides avenae]|nr:hypothetical protein AAVH_43177 [Aphelenchus avenae]